MRGMKVLRTSLLSIFLIFYSLSGQVMGGTVLKPAAEQGMKQAPSAASQKDVKKESFNEHRKDGPEEFYGGELFLKTFQISGIIPTNEPILAIRR